MLGESGVSYSYLDPEKKHKVADLTLKAIQKKALLSYYERHAGKAEGSGSSQTGGTNNKGALDSNQVSWDIYRFWKFLKKFFLIFLGCDFIS